MTVSQQNLGRPRMQSQARPCIRSLLLRRQVTPPRTLRTMQTSLVFGWTTTPICERKILRARRARALRGPAAFFFLPSFLQLRLVGMFDALWSTSNLSGRMASNQEERETEGIPTREASHQALMQIAARASCIQAA